MQAAERSLGRNCRSLSLAIKMADGVIRSVLCHLRLLVGGIRLLKGRQEAYTFHPQLQDSWSQSLERENQALKTELQELR